MIFPNSPIRDQVGEFSLDEYHDRKGGCVRLRWLPFGAQPVVEICITRQGAIDAARLLLDAAERMPREDAA